MRVQTRGGALDDRDGTATGTPVRMTGPATTVFEGEWTGRRRDANARRGGSDDRDDRRGTTNSMDARDVAEYLKQNPKFFEDYADVIAEIFVPHPHGGHAIPIAERQIFTLREKNARARGASSRELIRFGGENDAIGEKLHRSTLALFAAPDLETTLAVLYHSLKEDFGVPQVAARLWGKVPEQSYLPELAATSAGGSRLRRRARRAVLRLARRVRVARMVRGRRAACVVRVPAAAHGADVRPARARRVPIRERFHAGHGHAST